jgi:hypothetical protein
MVMPFVPKDIPMDARAELLDFADQLFHKSVLAVEPHPDSEEHRRRLIKLVQARRGECQRLASFRSAEALAAGFLTRLWSGGHDEADRDAAFLGLPGYADLADAFRTKAESLGICGLRVSEKASFAPAAESPEAAEQPRERQERLLEEGLNETFPASDPVSVSIVN